MSWADQEFIRGQNLSIRTEQGEIYKFEEVESFTNLVTVFTRKPETGTEILWGYVFTWCEREICKDMFGTLQEILEE